MKIFVIGFNKTATTSLHYLFLRNGKKSQHEKKWNLEKYDCFSDGDTKTINVVNLYEKYPSSIFILNTRNLRHWLTSRFKHGSATLHSNIKNLEEKGYFNWAYPPTVQLTKKWIKEREEFYTNTLNFFIDKPDKLIIVNIDKPNWIEFLCDALHLKCKTLSPKNVRISSNNIDEINTVINETFDDLNYDIEQQNSVFINSDLINLYKNNL